MKNQRKKTGLPPGSVVFVGNQKVKEVFIHYLEYNSQKLTEEKYTNQSKFVFQPSLDDTVDWYDVRGLHDTDLIESLGSTFKIHSLVLEDVAHTFQRPKFEEYENGNFLIFRSLSFDKKELQVKTEQIAVYFRKGLIISFQENETDLFENVRKRINSGKGKVREKGADYLTYALIDSITDNYFSVLDEIEECIESIENDILNSPGQQTKERIHLLKKELLIVRKSVAPLREAVSRFSKSDSELIEEGTKMYIRDLYDHTIQITDMVESYRDILNGLQDLYISEISLRMNQVMQVLTIITTIFVPLSFLAGLYGMNFENIPELHHQNGYFILLGVMMLIALGSLFYFKRKGWF